MAAILVVDDEPGVREIMQAACRLDGHDVRAASGMEEAVAAFLEAEPDLLILDLNMPGGGGEEVLERLASLGGTGDCRILFASGLAGDVSPEFDVDERVRGILQKPFGIDALRQAVKTALS